MKFIVKYVAVLGVFLFLGLSLNAQTIENSGDAAKRLRELYLLRAFDDGVIEGEKFVAKFPDDSGVKAWFIVNRVMADDPNALDNARVFAKQNEDDLWANYALVSALLNQYLMDEATTASEKFADSEIEDFIFVRANVLARNLMTAEALKFLDEKAGFITDKARLENIKGEIYYLSETPDAQTKAFAAFKKAQNLNPKNLDALFLEAYYLGANDRFDEAIISLRSAVKLSPTSFYVRQYLWMALWQGQQKKAANLKHREIAADLEEFRKLAPDTPKRLQNLATISAVVEMPEKKAEYEEIVLKNFNNSAEAETILISRIFNIYYYDEETGEEIPAEKKKYIAMIASFIKRPNHIDKNYLGVMYANYLSAVQDDKTISDVEFLRLSEEAIKNPTSDITSPFATIAEGLIKRGKYADAEKYAGSGMGKVEERLKAEDQDDPELIDDTRKYARKTFNALIGEALLRQEKYKDAEKYLSLSIEDGKEENRAVNLLGEVYEGLGEFDKAEKYYINLVALYDDDFEPDYGNLKRLYEKRNQTADGFDKYLEKIKPLAKEIRRADILSQKNVELPDLEAFSLKMADGKLFSSEKLKGKIVVINIWATWCVPCIEEMPEFQQLYKKYQTDKDVVILSINSEEDVATINDFMKTQKYDFPVIMSGDYTKDVEAIPTTWFVDRNGKVVYTKVGSTKNLIEEFDWRIEELKKN